MSPTIKITITAEAAAAVRAATLPGHEFLQTGTRNPDGTWTIPISLNILDRLEILSSLWGLSFSDTILRGLTQQKLQ